MLAGTIDPLAKILRFDPQKRTLAMAAFTAALTPHVAMPTARLEVREDHFLRPQAPPSSQDHDWQADTTRECCDRAPRSTCQPCRIHSMHPLGQAHSALVERKNAKAQELLEESC